MRHCFRWAYCLRIHLFIHFLCALSSLSSYLLTYPVSPLLLLLLSFLLLSLPSICSSLSPQCVKTVQRSTVHLSSKMSAALTLASTYVPVYVASVVWWSHFYLHECSYWLTSFHNRLRNRVHDLTSFRIILETLSTQICHLAAVLLVVHPLLVAQWRARDFSRALLYIDTVSNTILNGMRIDRM